MEEREREEQKPVQNWDGKERRRRSPDEEFKGDDRRAEPMERMPGGNPQGGNPGQGKEDPTE
jgi:hypothetical protein